MKLKIGNHEWEVATLNALFPIEFYKKTGKDVLKLERVYNENPLEYYDTMLHLAFALTGEDDFEAFCVKFTPMDLAVAYVDILEAYTVQSKPEVEAKGEKK